MEELIRPHIFNINWDNKTSTAETYNFQGLSDKRAVSHNVGIIIDNGSYECRAGWANCEEPIMKFKNVVAKPKVQAKQGQDVFLVGNDMAQIEQGKLHKKSPFEKNYVAHFGTQEHILDHIFTNLSKDRKIIIFRNYRI